MVSCVVSLALAGVVAMPIEVRSEPASAPEVLPRKHTLFVDFGGDSLTWVPTPEDENAAENTSFMARFEGSTIPPYEGGDALRQAVVQTVREHLAPFGVRVVEQRPPNVLPYTRAMVGGTWTDINADGPLTGVAAAVDCERLNQRHVVFAFVSDEPVHRQAMTISQESAHAWGLDHTLGDDRIMGYTFDDAPKVWGAQCTDVCDDACQGPGTVFCAEVHEQFCAPGQQDDTAELLYTFGGPEPDVEPPAVQVLSPSDGSSFEPGATVIVEADVSDDFGGTGWKLVVERDAQLVVDQPAYDRATTWTMSELPEGTYAITVEAHDHADHVTTDTVTIFVGDTPGVTESDGGSTSTAAQTGSTSGGEGGEPPDEDGREQGCGCRSGQEPGADLVWGLIVMASRPRWRVRRWCSRRRFRPFGASPTG